MNHRYKRVGFKGFLLLTTVVALIVGGASLLYINREKNLVQETISQSANIKLINHDSERITEPGVTASPERIPEASVEVLAGCNLYSFASFRGKIYSRDGYENPGFFTLLNGAEKESFKILGECSGTDTYAVDNNQAYYKERYYSAAKKIVGSDPLTFSLLKSNLNSKLAHDKNALYYRGERLECSNGSPIVEIQDNYYKDDVNIYKYIEYIETDELLSLCADPKSFEVLSGGFSRDKANLFFAANGTWANNSPIKIEGGDPVSFVYLSNFFSKDKGHIYVTTRAYEGLPRVEILTNADVKSFVVLHTRLSIAKDIDTVFIVNKILEKANASFFHLLPPLIEKGNILNGIYATDNSTAWFFEDFEVLSQPKQIVVTGADVDTLTNLDGIYAADKNSIYIRGKKVDGVAPEEFFSLGYGFARAGNTILGSSFSTYSPGYQFSVSCQSCNLDSFVVLNGEYAKDASNVYYYNSRNHQFTIVKEANIDNFQVTNPVDVNKTIDAQDANHSYRDGVPVL